MYANYTILWLLLPFLCITVYKADAQGFVDFPAGDLVDPQPNPTITTEEHEVALAMSGATPTRVSATHAVIYFT